MSVHPAPMTPPADVLALLTQLTERVEALEAQNRQLTGELATARSASEPIPPAPAANPTESAPAPTGARVTRRKMITGGVAAAVAGGAAIAIGATPAAANSQGGSFTLGDPTNTATATTGVTASPGSIPVFLAASGSAPGYAVRGTVGTSGITTYGAALHGDSLDYPGVFGTSGTASGVAGVVGGPAAGFPPPAGVVGTSAKQIGVHGTSDDATAVYGRSTTGNGVYGQSTTASGVLGRTGSSGFTAAAGVVGDGSNQYGTCGFSASKAGVRAASTSSDGIYASSSSGLGARLSGGRAALNLVPRGSTGKPTTGAHGRGDIVIDSAGVMFICTASGTPGTWVRVTTTPA